MNHTGLSVHLEALLKDWRDARKPQEQRMVEWYQDYMRISRDGDTKNVGVAKSKQANSIFIGSTRGKIRSARGKIVDSLFGSNKFPFDTEPQTEDLKEFADAFETIIGKQLEDMKAEKLLRNGVDEIGVYGTGFLFGPFTDTKTRKTTSVQVDPYTGLQTLQTVEQQYPCPRFELAQSIEVYPDPAGTDEQKGTGIFWCSLHSPQELREWDKSGQYDNIDEALLIKDSAATVEGRQHLEQARANQNFWFDQDSKRIRVARFFGVVPAGLLRQMEADEGEGAETGLEEDGTPDEIDADEKFAQMSPEDDDELIPAMVMLAGGVVIRAEQLAWEKRPVARCVYEEVPHEFWGVGLAENNAPTQKMTNAAVRLFFEGKGHALLGTRSIDRSLFLASEDFKHFPGKVYQFKPGSTPEQRQTAIIHHQTPDVSDGWLDAITLAEKFSDDDTAITKYTQGNDSGNLNKTATGISMIMGASSLPLKEVLQNIDSMWIERMVEDLVQWDLEFLEPEHVALIHGDELAQKWATIKQYGQSHFMSWKATGAQSFMAKELLLNKLMGFTNLVGSNPQFASLVDARELLEQVWDLTQIGRESPILKDEDLTIEKLPPQVQQMIAQLQQAAQAGEQAQQFIQQIKEQATQELQRLEEENASLRLALEHKENADQVAAFKAETERATAIGDQQLAHIEALASLEAATVQPEQQEQQEPPDGY